MGLPLPRRCCNCGDPVTMSYLGGHGRAAAAEGREEPPSWASHLAAADFSKRCSRDRVCDTCGGAAFCGHCCEEHHHGHVTSPAPTDDDATDHRRDSFCTGCGVAFSFELCTHHGVGHEVIPVDEYEGWHCARCTGSERWFPVVFAGIQTFQDNEGNLLVPLHRKPAAVAKPVKDEPCPPPWMFELATADFAKTCARDRVGSTCGGAAFCGHCCGEHHPGHDTAASTPEEKDGSEAAVVHRRDSFCTACRVAFCSDLCAHHASGEGHEVISIDEFIEWHCVRCSGSEWWFPALHYLLMLAFADEHGNLFVPLQWIEKVEDGEELPSWMTHLVTADFSKMCTRDRLLRALLRGAPPRPRHQRRHHERNGGFGGSSSGVPEGLVLHHLRRRLLLRAVCAPCGWRGPRGHPRRRLRRPALPAMHRVRAVVRLRLRRRRDLRGQGRQPDGAPGTKAIHDPGAGPEVRHSPLRRNHRAAGHGEPVRLLGDRLMGVRSSSLASDGVVIAWLLHH